MSQASPAADWWRALGAEPCESSEVEWLRWRQEVRTYCVGFEGLYPKRNKSEWREHWSTEYGKPQLRALDGSAPTIAEFEVVKAFRRVGWEAKWTDAFNKAPDWMREWRTGRLPPDVTRMLTAISRAEPTARPWDVLAWRADEILFVECKAEDEPFTKGESAFIAGAYKSGVPMASFAVVRGRITYPTRPE